MAAARPAAGGTHAAPSPPTPEHPIWAAQRGDKHATEKLLTECLPRVRNLIRYLVRSDSELDDITQEALLAVLRGLGTYRAEGALQSWIDRVVVRATFTYLKRRREEPRPSRADMVAALAPPPSLGDEYAARRRAVEVLDAMSLDQRHAVVLHHVLGMSVREIAEQVAAPVETVRSRLRLARQRLADQGFDVAEDGGREGHG